MRKKFWGVAALALWASAAWGQIPFPLDPLNESLLPFQLPGLDLNFSGAGVAARGMGGAFLGVSGDLSVIGFNPAGLAGLNRTQTALVYRYNRPGVRTQQFSSGAKQADFDYKKIDSFDQLEFGAVASPGRLLGHTFAGAFAYSTVADQFFADQFFGYTEGLFYPPNLIVRTATVLNRQASGRLSAFNLGAATRFGRFSFGANFQIYQGGFADTINNIIGPFTVNKGNGEEQAVEKQRLANKTSYRGTSLLLGAQAEYKKARLGVTVRVPSFKLGRTDLFRLKSNMDIGFYDTVLVSGLPEPSVLPGALFFTDSRLELPLSLSAGLAYTFGHSLLVDFDYSYTNWGAADLRVRRDFEKPFSHLATLQLGNGPVNLTSTHQVRFGWEYSFNPGFGRVAVRGGVRNLPVRTLTSTAPLFFSFFPAYQDSVIRAGGRVVDTISTVKLNYLNADEDKAAKGFGASAGLGIRWNQVALDVAYDYTTYLRTSQLGGGTFFHRLRQHRLFVGFTGYFTRL